MRDGCVFCDYAGPSPILGDYGDFIVFEPLNPVTKGHVLIVPKKHATDPRDDRTLTGDAFEAAASWAREHEAVNLIASGGRAASQTVMHLHVHVVPRHEGDGLKLPWSQMDNSASSER